MYHFRLFENIAHQINNIDDTEIVEQYINALVYGQNDDDYTLFDLLLDIDEIYQRTPFLLFGIGSESKVV